MKENKNITNGLSYKNILHTMGLFVIILFGFWLYSNINSFVHNVKIKKITIKGVNPNTQDYLYNQVKSIMGSNVLDIDLNELNNFIASKPLVYRSNVYRYLTGEIIINIIERNPYFLWEDDDGNYKIIDSENNIINNNLDIQIEDLIVVKKGRLALDSFNELRLALYSDANILANIKMLVFNGYRWDIYLKNGILIKLPQDNIVSSYGKLVELNKKYQITSRYVSYIDATSENKIYVLPK